jgi:hypothetical protein
MLCKVCQREDCQILAHQYASNDRGTGGVSSLGSGLQNAGIQKGLDGDGSSDSISNGLGTVKKQRWDRKAYNAYQREWMKKKRASKRAKVLADGTRPPEVKSGSE